VETGRDAGGSGESGGAGSNRGGFVSRNSCCHDFESRIHRAGHRGIGIGYSFGKDGATTFHIGNWPEGADMPTILFAIKFCPWCGQNLNEWFDSLASKRRKEWFDSRAK
jgi:hypothetical protein